MSDTPNLRSAVPYGPGTGLIRRFLVRLAALDGSERERITSAYALASEKPRWIQVERRLAALVERSGRQTEQDALAGPMLQLVRLPDQAPPDEAATEAQENALDEAKDGKPHGRAGDQPDVDSEEDLLESLDPVAEPILAALLALLVHDLLQPSDFSTLYSPIEEIIPFSELIEERAS